MAKKRPLSVDTPTAPPEEDVRTDTSLLYASKAVTHAQGYRVVRACSYVANGCVVTLAAGSVVSPLTHDMDAVNAGGAVLESIG